MTSAQPFLAGFSAQMSALEDVLVFADTHRASRPSSVTYTSPVPPPAPIIKSMLFRPQAYELRFGIPMRYFYEGADNGSQLSDLVLDTPQMREKSSGTRFMSFWRKLLLFLRKCKQAVEKFLSIEKKESEVASATHK
ncbi:hypothetical protein BDQ12DRAFT_6791 [Crucibulum laeve]|uniref:Uncharacterized protein n=1 Tax=Crucibulum laeve TaxID=68775 RepID=A0A5C3MFS7_9AGAR|nr:hypothetical protein BDQ12DRAFT_6791 [Crucibulum laeve]